MTKNKRNFQSSDVGTVLFAAGLTAMLPAHAAYLVLENYPTFTNPSATTLPKQPKPQTRQNFTIPFRNNQSTFGPHGQKTMQAVYAASTPLQEIIIIGRPDDTGDIQTAKKRANAIKNWFTNKGITTDRLTIQIKVTPLPNKRPHFFNSEIHVIDNLPTTYATAPVPQIKTTIIAPSRLDTPLSVAIKARPRSSSSVMTTPSTMPSPQASHIWQLFGGQTLYSALANWSAEAGWNKPIWHPADPYYIETSYAFNGTLVDALTNLNSYIPSLDFDISIKQKQIIVTEHK